DCFAMIEQQLARVLRHLPKRALTWLVRMLVFPLGRHADGPGDLCSHRVATVLQTPGNSRERLTAPCWLPDNTDQDMGLFDAAMQAATDTAALRKRLRRAIKRGQLQAATALDAVDEAHELGLLDDAELAQLTQAKALHDAVIHVDTFAVGDAARAVWS